MAIEDSRPNGPTEIDVFNLVHMAQADDYSRQEVEKIKILAHDLLFSMNDVGTFSTDPVLQGEQRRRLAIAKTHLETAVMFAVKARFVGYSN